MTSFFQSIAAGLTGQNQSLNIDVQGVGNGQLKVLISANLGPIPENAGTHETKLRVALSRPLIVTGTPEQIEEGLASRLAVHAQAVNEGLSMLDEIRSIGAEAVAQAKGKTEQEATPCSSAATAADNEADTAAVTQPSVQENQFQSLGTNF
jgi:PRTRC genetic system protein E